MKPIVVIGGGISGLAAAYYLQKRGLPVTLIEPQPNLGGLIQTVEIDGCLIEAGPDSFLSSKTAALDLIRELGLESEVIDSNDHRRVTYIWRGGRLVPMPDGLVMMAPTKLGPLLATPLLSWRAKLKAGTELLRRPNGSRPDRSVAAFVEDHYGREAVEYLAEPLLTGVFGGDVEKLSARQVLSRFIALEERYGSVTRGLVAERKQTTGSLFKSLKGGMEQLVTAITSKLAGVRIIRAHADAIEPGWRARAGGEWFDAAAVIIATRAWQAAPLVERLDGELADLLASIEYSSATTAGLTYQRAGFPHSLNGFGFLVPKIERRNIAACTWVTTKFEHRTSPDRILLRAFLGGDAWCGAANEEILAAIEDDLRFMMSLGVHPNASFIARWPRSMPQYFVGHYNKVEAIRARQDRLAGLYLAGNYFDGVGVPDCIRGAKEVVERI